MVTSSTRGGVQFEGCVNGPASDHFGHLARVQVELIASADCVAGCIQVKLQKFYPSLKLRGFVDDITALLVVKTGMWLKCQRRW